MLDDTSTILSGSSWRRRPLLRAIGGAGALGLTAPLASHVARAEHPTDPCAVTIEFNREQVAHVFDVTAAGVTSLTVFYFDTDRTKKKQADIDPTTNADYGEAPLRVRYDADEDKTTIQIGGPNTALRRVVAFGPDCRTAETNPLASAAGENDGPTADFTWTPDPAIAGEPVTFTSTATDPEGNLIHHGWDFDADGTEDATGEEVTHTFTTTGDHDVAHTVIDDFDATDSVTKSISVETGLWPQVAKLLADDGEAGDAFGFSAALAVDGTTALVAAPGDDDNGTDSGAVYVFIQTDGTWSQEAKLLATDGAAGDRFGWSVDIDADTAFIGTQLDDDNGTNAGSAYVFTRTDGSWSQEAKLLADDGDAGDLFGRTVALDGDTALVGAPGDEDNGTRAGSAYVFTRAADGTWSQHSKLTASDGDADDRFGHWVALDGDTALIGANTDEDPNGDFAGSAYVFTQTNGTWTEQAKLIASDGDAGDMFGFPVALDGSTAMVGANRDEDPNGDVAGSAYVFNQTDGTWTEQAKLVASDGNPGDRFGISLTLDGDTALIAAPQDDDNGTNAGSAYVFTQSDGTWSQEAKLLATDGDTGDLFGSRVALAADGTIALVGARGDDDNGDDAGAAYVFER